MDSRITVETGIARVSDTERGVDVSFDLTIDGETTSGEVTLLLHADVRMGYGTWGDVDHWLDSATVARLGRLDDTTRRSALDLLAARCAEEADAL